ncbi:MAG: SPOR domain-containing protein [Hydrogenophaga sp.]|uniref:SPOR domain-containing protein n=1 Tax=Hydrogenophaga sp. TaxID=1904254 RepID=UPI00276542E6|nr:SPOR domain-containing protein [Hydrogenophaga sp.]MDP2418581.1 SPOR domain-containing protein [Hydrogenophaga sp.]MDZ4187977.1 SPOR domain-containing protein [Hydrogenophaga sp.]
MLRWVIVLLVLANAGYFAWTEGYLAPLGLAVPEEREPQRLQAQIKPETIRLLNAPRTDSGTQTPAPNPAPSTPAKTPSLTASTPTPVPEAAAPQEPPTPQITPAPAPAAKTPAPTPAQPVTPPPVSAVADARSCWLTGAFTERQADSLRAALTLLDLPRGTWQLNESRSGGRWIVYMGRYDNTAQVERKKAELRELNVAFRDVSSPGLSPGLALGTYSSEAAAEKAIQIAARAGVRTARVVQDRAESTSFSLRLPNATPAQRNAVAGLGAALVGKPLRPCN